MKRILLFVLTNLAVMVVVGIVTSLLGVGRYTGTNTGQLMVFSLVVGFSGAIVSLLMSKPMAKMSMGVQVIAPPRCHQAPADHSPLQGPRRPARPRDCQQGHIAHG